MADEQTPQSELIDDAIRQAERQLEEKLQALRMSALGEPAAQHAASASDTAVLRPTDSVPYADEHASGGAYAQQPPAQDVTAPADFDTETPVSWPGDGPAEPPVTWQETGGEDVSFAPVSGPDVPSAGTTDLYVPEEDDHLLDDASLEEAPPRAPLDETAGALRESLSATVTDLTPLWADDSAPAREEAPMPTTRRTIERSPSTFEAPPAEPTPLEPAPRDLSPQRVTTLPSEDEMQFWAHTRTALRNLQQITDGIPTQIVGGVSTEVSRLLHEELGATEQAVRAVQAATEHELPRMGDRLQQAIEQAVAAPNNAIRQVRDEIPTQVDRAIRSTHDHLRDELDRTTASIHGAVQHDIVQLEQSIASNVTRMTQDTSQAVARVESDVDVLGETVVRFERGVHGEFDRLESQLRGAIERVEQNVREELVEPTETVRKLDDELPSRFGRIERAVVEQLQHGQRDVSHVLTSIVEADRAALDKLTAISSSLEEDRARRSEDLDVVVDTVTTGWEALAGAIRSLYEQADENSKRLTAIEQRLLQLRDVENAFARTLEEFQRHMRDLKPSPILVTVSHDEAEVQSRTRAGWSAPDQQLGRD